jgi:hypothetical protein
MPKQISKLITNLEDITKKIECTLDDFGEPGDDILTSLTDALEALDNLNDELDSQLED